MQKRNPYAPPVPTMPTTMPIEAVRQPSPKSYGTAVCLSAVFGFLGIQHFYLGRIGEGLLDVALSLAWVGCFATGHFALGLLFLAMDGIHAFVVTIQLLTGSFRDGEGRIVCYPGQRLPDPTVGSTTSSTVHETANHDMRRPI